MERYEIMVDEDEGPVSQEGMRSRDYPLISMLDASWRGQCG